jgi:glycosyltransferase involved in cell wall biosynthesis
MADFSIWVVIPAYNEEPVIGNVLRELVEYKPSFNVVVVDDGSTDGTAAAAARLRRVHLLCHPINLGQGAALATGIEYALQQKADVVVTFDADGQMRPADIDKLVEKVKEGYDVALGSRFLNVQPEGMPPLKKFLLRLAVLFTRMTGGLKVTDIHNGLRAFRPDALRKIVIMQNQMAHASEILSEIARNRLKYCEVPVGIRYTDYSKAKGQSILNSINIMYELLTGGRK